MRLSEEFPDRIIQYYKKKEPCFKWVLCNILCLSCKHRSWSVTGWGLINYNLIVSEMSHVPVFPGNWSRVFMFCMETVAHFIHI